MAIHYQDKDDEIDRLAKEERAMPVLILVIVMFALIAGIWAYLTGGSLKSYGRDMAGVLGLAFAYWLFSPFYYEFRLRTKEANGKATATLERLERLEARFGERLNVIEEKLDTIEHRSLELPGNAPQTGRILFPELAGIHHGLQQINKVEREMRDAEKLDRIRARDGAEDAG